ncbi:unnamed protein product [Phytomonas sp. EM1]|nr:unnamed protein product [Phytomonas sp. EM1]|eukprot:CCW61746.1 unnamed protein product [Phytomonas sp. isolate EM1]
MKSESQDASNMRIQQLRERLELYNATINRAMGTRSASTTSDGAAKLSKQFKAGNAVSDPYIPMGTHRSPPKTTTSNTTSQKLPGATRLASHIKKTIDSNSGGTSTVLKSATDIFAKKNKKPSPIKKALDIDEKSSTDSTASVSKEHVDIESESKPAFVTPPVRAATAKSPTLDSKLHSNSIDAEENRASNSCGSPSMHSAGVNDNTQGKASLPFTRSSTIYQSPFRGASPTQVSPFRRAPPVSIVPQALGVSRSRPTAAHHLWDFPSRTNDADPMEDKHKIVQEEESLEDTSTSGDSSDSSSSDEEAFNQFLEKILSVNPSMEKAIQETLSNSHAFLKRTTVRGGVRANTEDTQRGIHFTPLRTSTKHLDPQEPPDGKRLPGRDHSRHGDPKIITTPSETNPLIFSEKSETKPASQASATLSLAEEGVTVRNGAFSLTKVEVPAEGSGDAHPQKGLAQGVSFDKLEVAFQNLETVVHAMQKVYRATGIAAFPPDLPQSEEAASLAAVRDRLVREEADLRADPPNGPLLVQVKEASGMQVEGLARRLIQECESAMDSLKEVEDRRWKLQDKRQRLEMRRKDLKERQEARALINDENEQLRKRNDECALALREREKKYMVKLAEHSVQEKDIQDHIGEVEQLGHKITSWLRILEDRDSNLSAKEEKLRRVQVDLQRRAKDVQAYKELKNKLEAQAPRREITTE